MNVQRPKELTDSVSVRTDLNEPSQVHAVGFFLGRITHMQHSKLLGDDTPGCVCAACSSPAAAWTLSFLR